MLVQLCGSNGRTCMRSGALPVCRPRFAHRRMRIVMIRPFSPARVKEMRPELKAMIAARVETPIEVGWFGAVRELARFLPMEAVSHFVGLSGDGRERMMEWAAAPCNAVGPDHDPYGFTGLPFRITRPGSD